MPPQPSSRKRTAPADSPLPKGEACSRCKARKVRCTGDKPACAACLRTARFRGHEISMVQCAYHGEGVCSEDSSRQPPKNLSGFAANSRTRPSIHSHVRDSSSYRNNSDSSVFSFDSTHSAASFISTTSSVPSSAPSSLFSLPQASSSSLYLSEDSFSLPPPSPQFAYPPGSTTSSPKSATECSLPLVSRRLGRPPMKIDLPTSNFATLALSQSAPPSAPLDWQEAKRVGEPTVDPGVNPALWNNMLPLTRSFTHDGTSDALFLGGESDTTKVRTPGPPPPSPPPPSPRHTAPDDFYIDSFASPGPSRVTPGATTVFPTAMFTPWTQAQMDIANYSNYFPRSTPGASLDVAGLRFTPYAFKGAEGETYFSAPEGDTFAMQSQPVWSAEWQDWRDQ